MNLKRVHANFILQIIMSNFKIYNYNQAWVIEKNNGYFPNGNGPLV